MYIFALFLTLLAGGLSWGMTTWLLRRQLAPILASTKRMLTLADSEQLPHSLPLADKGEVGELAGSLNRLFENLAGREIKLKDSELHLRRIIERAPGCINIVDAEGRVVQINPAGLSMVEADSHEEIIGLAMLELVAPEHRQAFSDGHERVLAGELIRMEFEVLGLKGRRRWVSTHAVSMLDKGKLVYLAFTRDITERRQLENSLRKNEAFYRAVTDQGQALIWMSGLDKGCYFFNLPWLAFTGRTLAQESGSGWVESVHPEDVKNCMTIYASAFDQREKFSMTYRLRHRDGQYRILLEDGAPRYDSHQIFVGFIGHCLDITERMQAEESFRIAASAFETQQGMAITNAEKMILRVNKAFTEITGYTAEDAIGQNPLLLQSGRHDAAFYTAMWTSIAQSGSWHGEIWNRRKSGEIYPESLSIQAVKDGAGKTTHYIGAFSDISSHKAAENEIQHLAFYDPLTLLPNRRQLMDRLKQALLSCHRHQQKGALLFIDLDNFKVLNDTLGHVTGDLLLQQVAKRLSTCIREGDTVARLGGDEFVVMLENLSANALEAAAKAKVVAEKISSLLNQIYVLGSNEHHSSPSIGVTLFGDIEESTDEPLKRADLAMYQAKAAGRNTLRFFDPQMQAEVSTRAALENGLHEALDKHQFVLHYQAQMEGSSQLMGAEVLVRWNHPQHGLVFPAKFIPLAEETGLILPLGNWVLETACKQLALWASRPEMALLKIAVNVSVSQFRQSDFVEQVQAVLARSGANPQRLKLELTESLLVFNVEDVIAKMSVLKALGVGFSLDDFGTGYSSLSYLKRLPLSQLKIDQGFVRDILNDSNDAAIAKMVIALADSLGLAVIAEGVETEEEAQMLLRLGCHSYQGYLYSRPIPLEEFEAFALQA